MNIFIRVFLISIFLTLTITQLISAEQVEKDMFAAVVVNPLFNLSIDNPSVNFGYVEPGKSVDMNKDTFYNKVKCNSNKGKMWYLKISIVGEVTGPGKTADPGIFKWKVFQYEGNGTIVENWQPFSSDPSLVYTSASNDNTGEDVVVKFQYRLHLPGNAVAGVYRAKMMYTMTDIP